MDAGIVRVARPTESGTALVLVGRQGCTVRRRRDRHHRPHRVTGDATRGLRVDRPHPTQLGRLSIRTRAQRVRVHRDREMGPLPVHIAVLTAAQLQGGQVDERVGTALRPRPGLATAHPVTERIDRGLQQRAAFGIELPAQDEHAAIGLVALEPAALVGVVGIGEHAIGIEPQPGGLGEGAHGTGLERLRGAHQDGLEAGPPARRRRPRRGGRSWSRC